MVWVSAPVSDQPLPGCGRPLCCCSGSSTPPNSPTKTFRHAISASRGPALIPNSERSFRRIGRCCGPAAKYSSAKEPGSAVECAGRPIAESPMAPCESVRQNAPPPNAFLPPAPPPSGATPLPVALRSHLWVRRLRLGPAPVLASGTRVAVEGERDVGSRHSPKRWAHARRSLRGYIAPGDRSPLVFWRSSRVLYL